MTLPPGIRLVWREVPAGSARRDVSRALLAELLPGARFRSRCPACGGDHGRIRVEGADAAVSVSYVDGWAVAVAARGHERVGLDAVPVDARGLERVLPRLVPGGAGDLESRTPGAGADAGGSSAAPARAWARVEAVLKADGRGLTVDARRVDVQGHGDTWEARILPSASSDPSPAEGPPREWRGWDLDGPAGFVLAVAVQSGSGLSA
ncbi:hypothetical protein [uncultured Microbacterium sp.]|uniref:hypothetical protein n=1 Tax=uncultured Microbacterium sp. TaxID=191216 RepID=UPI0025D9A3E2|nr:hypothetical protein [uncultured Microbacterium sp.]